MIFLAHVARCLRRGRVTLHCNDTDISQTGEMKIDNHHQINNFTKTSISFNYNVHMPQFYKLHKCQCIVSTMNLTRNQRVHVSHHHFNWYRYNASFDSEEISMMNGSTSYELKMSPNCWSNHRPGNSLQSAEHEQMFQSYLYR